MGFYDVADMSVVQILHDSLRLDTDLIMNSLVSENDFTAANFIPSSLCHMKG